MYLMITVERVLIVNTAKEENLVFRLTFMRHGRYIVTDVTKNCPATSFQMILKNLTDHF